MSVYERLQLCTNLYSLSALLSVCEQLDGQRSGVLQCFLQVGETVTHMSAQAALSTNRHGAAVAEKTQHLWMKTREIVWN